MSTAKLLVKLPDELRAFFNESGYMPSALFESRANARLRFRRDGEIEFTYAPPILLQQAGFREVKFGRILIKDMSRTGVGILFHEQVFPQEKFDLRLPGKILHVTAIRCRRLSDACYEIGGRIDSLETVAEQGSS